MYSLEVTIAPKIYLYAFFREHGLKADPKDMERQKELQGREPRLYEDFVEETSKMWLEG
jgi:hypothetical protein